MIACRAEDLPYWIDEELWRVELAEPVRAVPHQLRADRGRLVERIDRWDGPARDDFAMACVLRVRDLAAELARQPLPDRSRLLGFCLDAIEFAPNAACAAYIAAMAAAGLSGSTSGADEERAWQAQWLCDRVGL
jgi:hypothetical protein